MSEPTDPPSATKETPLQGHMLSQFGETAVDIPTVKSLLPILTADWPQTP